MFHLITNLRGETMTDEPALLLSDNAASALFGISRSTFWRRVADGTFPQPVRIGGTTRWRRSELIESMDQAAARRDGEASGGQCHGA